MIIKEKVTLMAIYILNHDYHLFKAVYVVMEGIWLNCWNGVVLNVNSSPPSIVPHIYWTGQCTLAQGKDPFWSRKFVFMCETMYFAVIVPGVAFHLCNAQISNTTPFDHLHLSNEFVLEQDTSIFHSVMLTRSSLPLYLCMEHNAFRATWLFTQVHGSSQYNQWLDYILHKPQPRC